MNRPRSFLMMATLAVALGAIFVSCLRDPASVGDGTGSILLVVTLSADPAPSPPFPAPASLSVDSLSVEVRGTGMTPLQVVVPVVNGTASGTLDGIPAGRDRVVTALAWSADPLVYLYQGADTVTIESGKVAEAHLVMGRLQPGPLAIIEITPDTALVGEPVIADASASYDCYAPDDSLWFRFLLDDVEIRAWGAASRDTLPAPVKGSWSVGVEVRNGADVRDSAECALHVMNSAPWAPSAPSPEIGDTVPSLIPLLRWTSGDPDGDSLVSTVWFGVDSDAVQGMRPPATSLSSSVDSLQLPPLQPGTQHFWKVDVSDGQAASAGDLWSFWTAAAAFTAEPESLLFPCGANQHAVTLAGVTTLPLGWTAATQEPWLDVSPQSGVIGGSPQTVWVTVVSRAGYDPGTHWGMIVFEAGGFSVPVVARMEVAPEMGGTIPDSLILSAPDFEDTLSIQNVGCGDLAWEASTAAAWLTPLPSSGIVAEGGFGALRVRADTTGLLPGQHSTTMILGAGDVSFLVHVDVLVPGAVCLAVEPDSVHIGAASSSTQCTVTNCGTSPLNWGAAWDEAWITVAPASGIIAPFESQPVGISVDIGGLPSGLVHTGIWFNGGQSPVYLVLTVVVPGQASLDVTPDEIYLPADTDSALVTVTNAGTGVLAWTVTAAPAWCIMDPSSGVLEQGEQTYPVFTVNRAGLVPGPLQGQAVLGSNGGEDAIDIAVDVGAAGCTAPIYAEAFNLGEAVDWQPTNAGTWTVTDGRYMVQDLAVGATAWSQHALDYQGSSRGQVDVLLGSDDAIAWAWLVLPSGRTIPVEGTSCDAVSVSLGHDGAVRLEARVAATGVWFPCSAGGQGMFFADGWNSIAVVIDETHLAGMLNGEVATEYQYAMQLRLPPLGAVALAARGGGIVEFDRVVVCPEEE